MSFNLQRSCKSYSGPVLLLCAAGPFSFLKGNCERATGLIVFFSSAAAAAQSYEDKEPTKHTMVECSLDIQGEKEKDKSVLIQVTVFSFH